MDRTIDQEVLTWKTVLAAIKEADQQVPHRGRPCTYPDTLIISLFLWAVWHNRTQSWAINRRHYGALFRPRTLPSLSQFNRRCNSPRFWAVLQRVHEILCAWHVPLTEGYLDGKALTVSPVSKDPDATRGHLSGGYGKGYKLHAYVTRDRRIVVWSVTGLHAAEQTVALELVAHLPPLQGSLSLADSNYDSAPLHKGLNARGGVLLTPLKGQQQVKGGQHHAVTLRQMGPGRRAAVAVWREHEALASYVMKDRITVESTFSVLTMALDLRLPPWVRRQHRVQRWVGGKIILYHARLQAQAQAAA